MTLEGEAWKYLKVRAREANVPIERVGRMMRIGSTDVPYPGVDCYVEMATAVRMIERVGSEKFAEENWEVV